MLVDIIIKEVELFLKVGGRSRGETGRGRMTATAASTATAAASASTSSGGGASNGGRRATSGQQENRRGGRGSRWSDQAKCPMIYSFKNVQRMIKSCTLMKNNE